MVLSDRRISEDVWYLQTEEYKMMYGTLPIEEYQRMYDTLRTEE
jgi:hypothetical protein